MDKPITQMLAEMKGGKADVLNRLLPLVYDELRRLAEICFNRERADHTLQPTALVHEAYLRLVGGNDIGFENRAHFFGVAARSMREILIEHARARNRQKRGGDRKTRIVLDEAVGFDDQRQFDVLAVDQALKKLENLDWRQARVVEMKFFGGLKIEEIAAVLDVSPGTIKNEWSTAKMLLCRMLDSEG